MHLKCHHPFKDGKEHRYWSIVESRRCSDERIVQRHVLYLGEINDSQKESWLKCIEVFDASSQQQVRLALFPADRAIPEHAAECGVQVRLGDFFIRHPRQWGACWLFVELWRELQLDRFWKERLPNSREGTSWVHVLTVLCAHRLICPGSEWRLHREWFQKSAMADLLGEDFALAAKDTLYRCLDKLLAHKEALFGFLKQRWEGLFGITYDVLLYDLTSTYCESDPPFGESDKRQFGYSRDKRFDCVQVVIGLVVTPEGFPLTYEVLPGNTADKTTLKMFLEKIESLYGKARRVWVMDRGIPTEEVLSQMRQSDPPILYIVGTPKGRLSRLESQLVDKPWQEVRAGVQVKLLAESGGTLHSGPERRPCEQGACHATPSAQGAVASARGIAPDQKAHARRALAQAGRRPTRVPFGLATGGRAPAQGGRGRQLRNVHFPIAQKETAPSAPTRGPISVANQYA